MARAGRRICPVWSWGTLVVMVSLWLPHCAEGSQLHTDHVPKSADPTDDTVVATPSLPWYKRDSSPAKYSRKKALCTPPWPNWNSMCGKLSWSALISRRPPYTTAVDCPAIGPPRLFDKVIHGPRRLGNRIQMDVQWAPPEENADFVTGYRVAIHENGVSVHTTPMRRILNQFEIAARDVCGTSNICQLTIASSSGSCHDNSTVVALELFTPSYLEPNADKLFLVISAMPDRHGGDPQSTVSARIAMPSCRALRCPDFRVQKVLDCEFLDEADDSRICHCEPLPIAAGTVRHSVDANNSMSVSWAKPRDYFLDGVVKTFFSVCVHVYTKDSMQRCNVSLSIDANDTNSISLDVLAYDDVTRIELRIMHVRNWCTGLDYDPDQCSLGSDEYVITAYPQIPSLPSNEPAAGNVTNDTMLIDVLDDVVHSHRSAAGVSQGGLIAATVGACVAVLVTVVVTMAIMARRRVVEQSKRMPMSDIKQTMLSNTIICGRLERLVKPDCLLDFLVQEGCMSTDCKLHQLVKSGETPTERSQNMIKMMRVCDEKMFETIQRYLRYGPLSEEFKPPSQRSSLSCEYDSPSLILPPSTSASTAGHSVRRVYITYSRYPSSLKETVLHFATVLANCGVDVVLDQFYEVEAADCLSEWVDKQFDGAHYIIVVLSPKYPLNLSAEAKRILGGTEDFMVSFYEAKLLQGSAISGRENFIVPVYFGYGACPPVYIPLLLKNKSVYTISPQCDQHDKGLMQLVHRLYQINMLTSSL